MRRGRNERGSVLVEASLVSVPFFALLLGVLATGYLVFTYNSVSFMAQQGVRWASVHGNLSSQPATKATVQNYVRTQAAGLNSTSIIVVTNWSPDENPGSTVSVNVSYTATPLVGWALPASLTMQCTSTAAVIH
ncbi:MAG: TadE/TadG family type IV pilus assembly protein [Bryobacteraceae bacterium]|jgi:Flp pilus assembly protein TadG